MKGHTLHIFAMLPLHQSPDAHPLPGMALTQPCWTHKHTDTVSHTHPFLSVHGQDEGEERRRNFICSLRLCSGFNRGRQGQQAGRGELRGIALARDKGPREGGGSSRRRGRRRRGTQYLDKPCKVERGDAGIGLARTFSSHKFSLAA